MKQRNHLGFHILKASYLLVFAMLILAFSPPPIFGSQSISPLQTQPVGVNHKILKGINLLYQEQFDAAEKVFSEFMSESPKKPGGYFYFAMVSWSRLSYGFWSQENVDEYLERVDRAIRVAKERIEGGTPDSYDYFFLGGALGFKGRFELMREKYLPAFFLASDAVDALKTCLRTDPKNVDVMLGLGTFDYYTARLSGLLKFLTYLLVHRGNKEEGLRKLHLASEEGIYSATEAKSMLLHIYLFLEQDYFKALELAEDLAEEYDRNSRYKLLSGVSYVRLGMNREYEDLLDEMRQKSREGPSSERSMVWKRRIVYLESIFDLFQARYAESRSKLRKLLKLADATNDPAMIAWPLVKIGMSYQLEGNEEEASRYYQQVLHMENGAGAQFLAKKLLREAPKKNDPFIGY